MGSDGLQVVPSELEATAGQWQALSSQLSGDAAVAGTGVSTHHGGCERRQRSDRCRRGSLYSADAGNGWRSDYRSRWLHQPRGHVGREMAAVTGVTVV